MKRTPRAGHAVLAGALALAIALAPGALAVQDQGATPLDVAGDIAQGSSTGTSPQELVPTALAAQGVVSDDVVPKDLVPEELAGADVLAPDGFHPDDVIGAVAEVARAADGAINDGVVPAINYHAGNIRIVLDPSTIPGLAEALAPKVPSQLSPSMRGRTAAGHEVVFPTSGTLTSGYGMRWGVMHNGIDVANPIGTPIYSVMDGTVISSGPAQGFGNWIRVLHDDGSRSVYGHMHANSLLVREGDRVSAGQQIASIGNEGQSTGPHLHFEIHPDGHNPVDPQAWFAQQGIVF